MNEQLAEQKKVVDKIISLSEQIEDELNKEDVDKEKVFRLRYAQMIQGLYLNNELYNNL